MSFLLLPGVIFDQMVWVCQAPTLFCRPTGNRVLVRIGQVASSAADLPLPAIAWRLCGASERSAAGPRGGDTCVSNGVV